MLIAMSSLQSDAYSKLDSEINDSTMLVIDATSHSTVTDKLISNTARPDRVVCIHSKTT